MTKGGKAILILGAVVIVVLLYALVFVQKGGDEVEISESEDTNIEETTNKDVVDIGGGNLVEVPEGGTFTPIPLQEEALIEKPELNRPVTIPDFYPNDAAKIVATKIADAIVAIEDDSTSFDNWLTLANLRQQIEDYTGAVEIYDYLNIVNPENDVSYLNLGNLYHLHLRDFEKAEENLKQAIVNNSINVFAYTSLHELYRDSYKTDTLLAEEVLLQGIDVIDNDINLFIALSDYYKQEGRNEDAINYFNQTKTKAEALGNKPLADRMLAEITLLQED